MGLRRVVRGRKPWGKMIFADRWIRRLPEPKQGGAYRTVGETCSDRGFGTPCPTALPGTQNALPLAIGRRFAQYLQQQDVPALVWWFKKFSSLSSRVLYSRHEFFNRTSEPKTTLES